MSAVGLQFAAVEQTFAYPPGYEGIADRPPASLPKIVIVVPTLVPLAKFQAYKHSVVPSPQACPS